MNKFIVITNMLLAALVAGVATPVAHAATPDYALGSAFTLGPAGRWDYTAIDQQRHRLYLSRGDHVQVVQLPAGQPIADIADTPRVHGFAFAQEFSVGFISIGERDSVTVFDLNTMRAQRTIKTGGNPDAMVYDLPSRKLFVFNGKTRNVTIIDARTLGVVATVAVSGRPESAVSDGAGKVYVNIEDHPGIDVIDVASNTVRARWKLDGCDEPSGLAIDVAHQRLFSTCQNRIMAVTDALTGKRVADVAIGEHPDAAEFDPQSGRVYSANGGGDGSLSIIHVDDADHFSIVSTLRTAKGAKTLALDSTSKTVYLPTAVQGQFTVLVAAPQ